MLKKIAKEARTRVNMLVYGKAGIGKTCLIRTLLGQGFDNKTKKWIQVKESSEKICILSAESGLLSINSILDNSSVDAYEITSHIDMQQAYKMLSLEEMQQKYSWVVVDSLTELSESCSSFYKKKYLNEKNQFEKWERYYEDMIKIIKKFRDLTSYNILFTAAEKIIFDERKIRYTIPSVVGNALQEKIPYIFDMAFHYSIIDNDSSKRALIIKAISNITTQERSGCLTKDFYEPNLLDIYTEVLSND
jgi:GTPase SAR1 family protein